MGLELLEVQHDQRIQLARPRLPRAGFTDPGTKLWPMFTGDYRPDPALREAALDETTRRLISWHRSDPTSHWLKVVVGGGRWGLYGTGNPYDGHGDVEASWWLEGEPRELASTLRV